MKTESHKNNIQTHIMKSLTIIHTNQKTKTRNTNHTRTQLKKKPKTTNPNRFLIVRRQRSSGWVHFSLGCIWHWNASARLLRDSAPDRQICNRCEITTAIFSMREPQFDNGWVVWWTFAVRESERFSFISKYRHMKSLLRNKDLSMFQVSNGFRSMNN